MVGRQTLDLTTKVRILVPQPTFFPKLLNVLSASLCLVISVAFDNGHGSSETSPVYRILKMGRRKMRVPQCCLDIAVTENLFH